LGDFLKKEIGMLKKIFLKIFVLSMFLFATNLYSESEYLLYSSSSHSPTQDGCVENFIRGSNLVVATILQGLAQTCNQVSNAIGAGTEKEKHQAALGVVGSLLNLAGAVTAQKELEKQEKKQTKGLEHDVTTRLIDLINKMIDATEGQNLRSVEKKVECLEEVEKIRDIKDVEKRGLLIEKILATPTRAKRLLRGLYVVLKDFGVVNISTLVEIVKEKIRDSKNQQISKKEEELDGRKNETVVSDDLICLVKIIWNVLLDAFKNEEGATAYLKKQFFGLVDYIYEKLNEKKNGGEPKA
jgi:hypothetical protein